MVMKNQYMCMLIRSQQQLNHNKKLKGEIMAISSETRALLFKRAGGKCECTMNICGHIGRCNKDLGSTWEAHHKTSVNAGGSDSLSNLIAMCNSCHKNTRSYGRS